jgi:glycosyltransferase involved in cell wall biosynthesis
MGVVDQVSGNYVTSSTGFRALGTLLTRLYSVTQRGLPGNSRFRSNRLSVVTNLPAPYRDAVFAELQRRLSVKIYLLANDEPGRHWAGRPRPYEYTKVPAIQLSGRYRPWHVPIPIWLLRRGHIVVAGFGPAAMLTAAVRPKSTLIWSEGTPLTEAPYNGSIRLRTRHWLVARAAACVAVGEASKTYFESLGARTILMLPNVAGYPTAESIATFDRRTSKLVLAHVGDWSVRKGADVAVEIFKTLRDGCVEVSGGVDLLIVGNVFDVPVPAGATYIGHVPDDEVWPLVHAHGAKFLLLMSRVERWGFVVTEAMNAGLVPVVAPTVGSAPDLLAGIRPSLVVGSASDATDVIRALHADNECFRSVLSDLVGIAHKRTPAWSVDVFLSSWRRMLRTNGSDHAWRGPPMPLPQPLNGDESDSVTH